MPENVRVAAAKLSHGGQRGIVGFGRRVGQRVAGVRVGDTVVGGKRIEERRAHGVAVWSCMGFATVGAALVETVPESRLTLTAVPTVRETPEELQSMLPNDSVYADGGVEPGARRPPG